jgi:hypothetical protein
MSPVVACYYLTTYRYTQEKVQHGYMSSSGFSLSIEVPNEQVRHVVLVFLVGVADTDHFATELDPTFYSDHHMFFLHPKHCFGFICTAFPTKLLSKGMVSPDWICLEVIWLKRPWVGHEMQDF